MSRYAAAVLAIALLPSLALSQRRGGMGGSKDADFSFADGAPSAPSITGKDFEKANP